MSPSFFIFALPRSGTAWLATFLSGPKSYCFHEPTADRTPAEWAVHATARSGIVGAIDTAAYLNPDAILEAIPRARICVLLRDPLEITRSCKKLGYFFNGYVERFRLEAISGERIEYAQLRDIAYLRDLWARLIGTTFDEERAQQLLEMNVERDVGRFLACRPRAEQQAVRMLS